MQDAWPILSANRATVMTITNYGSGYEVEAHKVENWDVTTGKSLNSFSLEAVKTLAPRQAVNSLFMETVTTAKGVSLLIRNPKGLKTTTELPGVTMAKVSDDGKWVIGHAEKAIKLFDASGKQRWSMNESYGGSTFGVAGKNVITTTRPVVVRRGDHRTGRFAQKNRG